MHDPPPSWLEPHRRHVLTPWLRQSAQPARQWQRGEGAWLIDTDGRRCFDLSSGLVAANLGHAHPELLAALQEKAARLCFAAPVWPDAERAHLAAALSALGPWPREGARVLFTTGGAEANDDAIKLARHLTGRPKLIASYRGYHGATLGAATLTGESRRWPAEPGVPGVVHVFTPYLFRSPFFSTHIEQETERALAHLRAVVQAEDPAAIAAVLLEPVIGSNGVIPLPAAYLAGVRALCDEIGALLIYDEVMCGFGRTGAAFHSLRAGVVPDLIVFAKGITSGYIPLGGVLVRERLAARYDDTPLPTGHTYSGHPLAVAVGLAAVRAYQRQGLFDNPLESTLSALLQPLTAHPRVGELRGLGAFWGLELVMDRASRQPLDPAHQQRLLALLLEEGVVAMQRNGTLLIAPPLVTAAAELEFAVSALARVLDRL